MIIVGVCGLSLLLIIGGFLTQEEDKGTILVLLGIVGLAFAVVVDGFERSDELYDLHGRETMVSTEYSTDTE